MIKTMTSYDLMETLRNTNEWLGATARAMASYPAVAALPSPMLSMMEAWGQVAERSFARMVVKPDWGIRTVTGADGTDLVVEVDTLLHKPFCDLLHFRVEGREPMTRRVLVVAPMSGHYATLVRSTVASLLPDCEVYVTDWKNARDIPLSEGKFDVEDYTLYLVDFIRHLGADIHVIAICQPAPLTLVAAAYLAQNEPEAQPRSMTLIGGPIDPDANATEVTDFGNRVTMGQLERWFIQRVGFKYRGVGRLVYPGLLQLSSFIAMNKERHTEAFSNQILAVAKGMASDHDPHNRFYDEYLAVMDMTAEFYLSTVERVFKDREIARNAFTIEGQHVDIGRIDHTAVIVVEGEKDDISAPGQCKAALALLTGLPDDKKGYYLEPNAGHYGIFAGSSWRKNIRPYVLNFLDKVTAEATGEDSAAPAPAGDETKPASPRRRPRVVSSGPGSSAAPDSVPV